MLTPSLGRSFDESFDRFFGHPVLQRRLERKNVGDAFFQAFQVPLLGIGALGAADVDDRVHRVDAHVGDDLGDVLGIRETQLRVIGPDVGGGFGSKSYTKMEPLTATLARKVLGDMVRAEMGPVAGTIAGILTNIWQQFKISVLFITHDFGVVAEIADRVAVLTTRPAR